MDTFDDFSFVQFLFRNPTDTVSAKIRVPGLNASKAANVFVSRFLPFSDESSICNLFFDAVVIEFLWNSFPFVKEIVNVPTPLIVDLEDGPQGFHSSLSFVRITFGFTHLCLQLLKCRFNQVPSIRRWFTPGTTYLGHDLMDTSGLQLEDWT